MPTIHIATPDGVQFQYDETEFQNKISRKQFAPGTLFWKDGMKDWQPIESLPEPSNLNPYTPSAANIPLQTVAPQFADTQPRRMTTLTTVVIILMSLSILSELGLIFSSVAQLSLLERPYTTEEGEANDVRQSVAALINIAIYLVSSIAFLVWVHRATTNNHAFGAKELTTTPGWSVGYYFIPIVNLFKPYSTMQETWRVSQSPSDWKSIGSSFLIGVWWFFIIVDRIASQIASRLNTSAESVESLKIATGLIIMSSLIAIPTHILGILVLRSIAAKQNALVGDTYPN